MTELCTIDLLVVDDFALEPMTRDESRDVYQLFVDRTSTWLHDPGDRWLHEGGE